MEHFLKLSIKIFKKTVFSKMRFFVRFSTTVNSQGQVPAELQNAVIFKTVDEFSVSLDSNQKAVDHRLLTRSVMTFNYMPYTLVTGLDAVVLELCFPYLSKCPEFSDASKSSFDDDPLA